MSGDDARQTQTTTTSLPSNQQNNVNVLLNDALRFYNQGGREFFPGDPVADFTANQIAGQQGIVDFAGGLGSQLVGDTIAANNTFLDPNVALNPANMPGFSGVVDNFVQNQTQNLTENILPYIRSGATASGQFGGTAQGIGEALATERTADSISGGLENLYLGAYGQGLNSFNQAINRAPMLFGLGLAPGQAISGVGAQQQGQNQREIQGDVARFEFEQNEPIFMLELLRQLTGQAGTYGGTTTSETVQEAGSSPINQALGGALSLASLWNPLTSVFAGLPGAAAGGAVGGPFLPQALAAGVS